MAIDVRHKESYHPSKYNNRGVTYEKERKQLKQKVAEKQKEQIEQVIKNLKIQKVGRA